MKSDKKPERPTIALVDRSLPLQNFGFVRMASHEAALAAITHLHGMELHGRVGTNL